MKFEMQVSGLDGLRRLSSLAPKQFDIVMRDAVRVSAIQARHVMIAEVAPYSEGGAGGRFAQSIRYRLSGLSAVIGSMAPTALSIERGRRVGEIVKVGLIERWVKRRGVVRGIFSVADRSVIRKIDRRAHRFAGVQSAERQEAARIVELIRRRGTAPKLYVARTVERSKDRVLRNFRESVAKALRGLAQIQRRAA